MHVMWSDGTDLTEQEFSPHSLGRDDFAQLAQPAKTAFDTQQHQGSPQDRDRELDES